MPLYVIDFAAPDSRVVGSEWFSAPTDAQALDLAGFIAQRPSTWFSAAVSAFVRTAAGHQLGSASCAWCRSSTFAPDGSGCECCADCGADQCLPAIRADQVTPGMAICHPDQNTVLDVTAVYPAGRDGVQICGLDGDATVPGSFPVIPYTVADADNAAALRIFKQETWLVQTATCTQCGTPMWADEAADHDCPEGMNR